VDARLVNRQLVLEAADGGRVVVEFADPVAMVAIESIRAAVAITRSDGPQGELEGVIVAEAARLGLEASVTGSRNPTFVAIRSRSDSPASRPPEPTPSRSPLAGGPGNDLASSEG
jgi:hypothetical protein